ncbi:N-acetylmuramoyl-L-alanine amidase [Brevibacterium jeotgali]|uniref:N-acetylmuramoyl-L-alanine amidase n=1 Tax=Brevibacterium jeotgali TaxID=1262550 RepID=A0A2H1L3H7_9MICO|nr:N-acetylmuramoyl-L-alanine amidase [Brevibacterium jeotgali]TWC01717.1 N-acetylmuramoyl-L-alanine amidase [Brevibacterium jeotgali]SMY11462.1 N-acetylmuramoyl-L-alanine amidase [Brevibacterium jeotgali]
MHARPLVAAVGGTAALLTLFAAGAAPSIAAVEEKPALTESELTDVDQAGLELPGARSSSATTFAASGASLTDRITNLPSLLRAPGAHVQHSAAAATNMSGTHGATTNMSGTHGSVSHTTEDGITIAGLTDEIDMPDDGLGIVGLVYDEQSDVDFEIRTKQDGEWSSWTRLDSDDTGQGDPGTDPYHVAGAQGAQVRILGDGWEPQGTRVLLVDPVRRDSDAEAVQDNVPVAPQQATEEPESGADPDAGAGAGVRIGSPGALDVDADSDSGPGVLDVGAAGTDARQMSYMPGDATVAQPLAGSVKKADRPTIRSRDDWGADESIGSTDPAIADDATAAIVHHTAGANDYDAEDVPAILRGIHSFHVEGQGWDDVGYNMFADKYGRLWEGRAGGLSKAVVGAHAVGYNTGTFGISVLGTFESKAPPQKTLDAVSGAIAWKLSLSGTSADAKTTVAGETMRTVIGHRDVGTTSCPGDAFYSALGDVRSTAVAMQEGERSVDSQPDEDEKKSGDEKSGDADADDGLGAGVEQLSPGVADA